MQHINLTKLGHWKMALLFQSDVYQLYGQIHMGLCTGVKAKSDLEGEEEGALGI